MRSSGIREKSNKAKEMKPILVLFHLEHAMPRHDMNSHKATILESIMSKKRNEDGTNVSRVYAYPKSSKKGVEEYFEYVNTNPKRKKNKPRINYDDSKYTLASGDDQMHFFQSDEVEYENIKNIITSKDHLDMYVVGKIKDGRIADALMSLKRNTNPDYTNRIDLFSDTKQDLYVFLIKESKHHTRADVTFIGKDVITNLIANADEECTNDNLFGSVHEKSLEYVTGPYLPPLELYEPEDVGLVRGETRIEHEKRINASKRFRRTERSTQDDEEEEEEVVVAAPAPAIEGQAESMEEEEDDDRSNVDEPLVIVNFVNEVLDDSDRSFLLHDVNVKKSRSEVPIGAKLKMDAYDALMAPNQQQVIDYVDLESLPQQKNVNFIEYVNPNNVPKMDELLENNGSFFRPYINAELIRAVKGRYDVSFNVQDAKESKRGSKNRFDVVISCSFCRGSSNPLKKLETLRFTKVPLNIFSRYVHSPNHSHIIVENAAAPAVVTMKNAAAPAVVRAEMVVASDDEPLHLTQNDREWIYDEEDLFGALNVVHSRLATLLKKRAMGSLVYHDSPPIADLSKIPKGDSKAYDETEIKNERLDDDDFIGKWLEILAPYANAEMLKAAKRRIIVDFKIDYVESKNLLKLWIQCGYCRGDVGRTMETISFDVKNGEPTARYVPLQNHGHEKKKRPGLTLRSSKNYNPPSSVHRSSYVTTTTPLTTTTPTKTPEEEDVEMIVVEEERYVDDPVDTGDSEVVADRREVVELVDSEEEEEEDDEMEVDRRPIMTLADHDYIYWKTNGKVEYFNDFFGQIAERDAIEHVRYDYHFPIAILDDLQNDRWTEWKTCVVDYVNRPYRASSIKAFQPFIDAEFLNAAKQRFYVSFKDILWTETESTMHTICRRCQYFWKEKPKHFDCVVSTITVKAKVIKNEIVLHVKRIEKLKSIGNEGTMQEFRAFHENHLAESRAFYSKIDPIPMANVPCKDFKPSFNETYSMKSLEGRWLIDDRNDLDEIVLEIPMITDTSITFASQNTIFVFPSINFNLVSFQYTQTPIYTDENSVTIFEADRLMSFADTVNRRNLPRGTTMMQRRRATARSMETERIMDVFTKNKVKIRVSEKIGTYFVLPELPDRQTHGEEYQKTVNSWNEVMDHFLRMEEVPCLPVDAALSRRRCYFLSQSSTR